jgi:4-amino-4-deoxy-L-arabinose transferase-like glycosyltransferase
MKNRLVRIIKGIISSDRKMMLSIFFIAVIARVAFIATLENRWYFIDTDIYHRAATNILAGKGFGDTYFYAKEYNLAPIYPIFLAAHYAVFGVQYFWVRLTESILGALTCIAIYSLGKKLFDSKIAGIAALIMAVHPMFLFLAGLLYVTNIFALLTVLSALCYVFWQFEKKLKYVVGGGVFLGLATLAEPTIFAFYPFLVLHMLFVASGGKRIKIFHTALTMFVILLTLTPWTIRNYIIFKKIVPVRASIFANFRGLGKSLEGKVEDPISTSPENDAIRIKEYNEFKSAGVAKSVYNIIMKDPKVFFSRYAREFIHFWTLYPDRTKTNSQFRGSAIDFLCAGFYSLLFALALIGIIAVRKKWKQFVLPVFLIFSFAFAYSFFETILRYRLPVEPLIILFSAQGIIYLYSLIRKNRDKRISLG